MSTYSSFYSPRLSYSQSQGKDWKLKGAAEKHWRHKKSLIHVSLTFWRMKICASRGSENTQIPLKYAPSEPPWGSDPEPTMKKTEENCVLSECQAPPSISSMGLWRYSVTVLWLRPAVWSDLTEKMSYLRLALDYAIIYKYFIFIQ